MTTRKELKLGNRKQLTFEPELDHDDDLEFHLDAGCDHAGHFFFLKLEEVRELRDHLDALLAAHDKPRVLSSEEVAAFAKRWDARVEGKLE